MTKKVELKKYTVTVPITVEVQFRVLSDNEKNALELVKKSNAHLNFFKDAMYIEDELYYTDSFDEDVFPHYKNHFVNSDLPCGFKWNETEIVPSSCLRDADSRSWMEIYPTRIEENGCVIHYYPDEE